MTAVRITPPTALPVSLPEVKAWLRVDITDDDPIIAGLIRAAVEEIENYSGLALISQGWRQEFASFESMVLYRRPLQAIAEVAYLDSTQAETVLSASDYTIGGVGQPFAYPALLPVADSGWPEGAVAVTVEYTAGFGDSWNDVPELIRHALLMCIHSWYDFRSDIVSGSTSEVPHASKALLRPYRPLAVA